MIYPTKPNSNTLVLMNIGTSIMFACRSFYCLFMKDRTLVAPIQNQVFNFAPAVIQIVRRLISFQELP